MTDKRIRSLFIVPSLSRAGAQTQAVHLVNGIDDTRFDKHLLVFGSELDQLDRIDRKTVQFHHIPRRSKFDFTFIKDISKLIDAQKIDVIHCTLQISLLFAWLACRITKNKPKLIVAIHTTVNVSRKDEIIDRSLYRLLFRSCKKIIFVCQAQKQYWLNKYPELSSKAEVVYNGVNTDFFSPDNFTKEGLALRKKLFIRDKDLVLVCVAGFRKEKAHNILLQALSELPANIKLILAGDGLLRDKIVEMIDKLGLEKRVHLLGNVSDVRPVLAASDISVLTSVAVETFSIAMLESMSMKTPFISSDIGGLSEAIVVGKTGDLFPVDDVPAFINVIQKYIIDKELLREMGEESRAVIKKKFSENLMVKNTEDLIENLRN